MEECADVLFRQFRNNGNDNSSIEIRNDLILDFRPHQLVCHNPFSLMCTAVVGEDRLTVTVMVKTIHGFMSAAANIILIISSNHSDDLICAAVQAVMPYKGITHAA